MICMSDPDWQREELISEFLKHNSKEKLNNFLEGILTPKELIEIPARLQIIKQLKKGVPQHKIADEMGLGVATVTRGSKEIQKGKFKYVK